MTGSDPKALEELEAQIAYNEKMLSDLSDVVVAQGQEIDRLKAEIDILGRQILQITEGEAGSH
ncbi:SlyX family protein [Pelagibius sp. CAU 1746]|uniref:SlyX family protein n=1 Tax=Pelagibius sp. CAU 1746 TaxID=3140370 RepID=UPI00325BEFB4